MNRPALQEALRYVRRGDTLVVHSMERLARSALDLISIVRDLTGRGVAVEFGQEAQTYTGEHPTQALMLGIEELCNRTLADVQPMAGVATSSTSIALRRSQSAQAPCCTCHTCRHP